MSKIRGSLSTRFGRTLSRALVAVTVAIENGGPLSPEPDDPETDGMSARRLGGMVISRPSRVTSPNVPGQDPFPPGVSGE